MKKLHRVFPAVCLALASAGAWPQDEPARDRGALLYETHCQSCHSAQVHWRDQRSATNWNELLFQVRCWQDAAGLQWNESDVQAVARYLNDNVYHFARTVEQARAR